MDYAVHKVAESDTTERLSLFIVREMQETQVLSLGQEDVLEKGAGNPLQCSCWKNPMDRGALQATVHGVAKSQTQHRKR